VRMMINTTSRQTHFRACNLCEAICGLEIVLEEGRIVSIRGDKKDPHSKGHICPKATALKDIHEDPDRVRHPIKKVNGRWVKISWKDAFDEISENLKDIQRYDKDAVAVYMGNPSVHSLGCMLFSPFFIRSLNTKNRFSATSVDQLPEQVVSQLMFGHSLLIPLPDLDRTDFLLIFGANPVVSNGSLMTAPGVTKRLKAIQNRGGKIIVVDPRKTETASLADQHIFVKPGSDVFLLLAMLHVVFEEELCQVGDVGAFTKGFDQIVEIVEPHAPEKTECRTGVPAFELRNLVRSFCRAKRATCYGRFGVSTQEYGTLTQWLIVVFNIVTGNLDSPGGAMFSKPAIDILAQRNPKKRPTRTFGSSLSRVRKLPRVEGEFPVATLVDEMETRGKGQIRALVTHAGNPVLSTPNSERLNRALGALEFMVSIDFYINETTRHAHIILPPLSALEREHYDLVFHALAIQNTSRFSRPLFNPDPEARSDAQIFLELSWRMNAKNWRSMITGWIKKEIILKLGSPWVINRLLKQGPYAKSHALDLKKLIRNPHGIHLGPMQPCLPNRLFTEDQRINLAPEPCIVDLKRLAKNRQEPNELSHSNQFDLLLIGRRSLRSNNSWLHNSYRMVKGKQRCLALIHPQDAQARNIQEGESVLVRSRVGQVRIPVSITEDIMPGVISIPHGWGHDQEGVELKTAKKYSGVNTNILTDHLFIDELSGNAALNGVPVVMIKDA